MNRDDRVLAIVLASEHLLGFTGLHFLLEGVERLRVLAVDRFARFGPLGEHAEVLAARTERVQQIAILFQPPAALEDALRFGLIFPEVGGGGAGFDSGQFFVGSCSFKDSYADPQRAC
jgi:hypothetical protein